MITGKKYKKLADKFEAKKGRCDRCGNDFETGGFLIHLPYRKTYVQFCGMCWNALSYGLWLDTSKQIKGVRV